MSRLIDADLVKEALVSYGFASGQEVEPTIDPHSAEILRIIDKVPTLDLEEMVLKSFIDDFQDIHPVRHGHWIPLYKADFSICSCCGTTYFHRSPYCPACGARMDDVVAQKFEENKENQEQEEQHIDPDTE